MAIIKWDASLKVGVEVIDEQHKKLVELINRLYDAMCLGKGKDVLGGVLAEVLDYAAYHFKTEEDLFLEHGYRDAPAHIQEHGQLTRTANELKAAFDSGKAMITIETMNFLKDWLVQHIMKSDKSYVPFLNSKGVK